MRVNKCQEYDHRNGPHSPVARALTFHRDVAYATHSMAVHGRLPKRTVIKLSSLFFVEWNKLACSQQQSRR